MKEYICRYSKTTGPFLADERAHFNLQKNVAKLKGSSVLKRRKAGRKEMESEVEAKTTE